ncbi:MAG: HEAT repeat domain-containing protein [Planctomycetota bacterium]|nr:HEAT repeat domain-containing protein [Planctomycetota bacterium]
MQGQRTPLRRLLALVLVVLFARGGETGPADAASLQLFHGLSHGPSGSVERAGADDEIVKEFKKYFRKYKDTATRVEAVLALEGTESIAVVGALVPVLKDKEPEVVRAAVRVLGGFETRPPVDALLARLEKNKDERVRSGLLRAIALGRYGGIREFVLPSLEDGSWEVRRRAVQALTETRDPMVAESIAPLLADSETAVRCAAFDGLAALRSELVVQPAIAALGAPVWQVRGCAIHALRDVRRRESIGPLIARMADEEGRLVADIGAALAHITGRDFGQRLDGWQRFWEIYQDRFEIPSDAELRRLREKQKERQETYTPPGAVTYHGIETPSRSILFVIDQSGSMEQEVIEKERFKDGDYPSYLRIDIVKTELIRTIATLEPYVRFNILAFATGTRRWKKTLVRANVLNKSSASTFVRRLESLGGASKEDLASVGLTGSANLEAGRTNTYLALMDALEAGGRGLKDKNYEVSVDTIFFLSDGRPSWGEFTDTDDIIREVNAANELRKVVIHAIAIGEFQKDFMRRLAEDNGGVFVDLGK